MKWFLVVCLLFAVTNIVTSRPNKDEDMDDYVLQDDENAGYVVEEGEIDDGEEEDDEDDDIAEPSDPPIIKTSPQIFRSTAGSTVNLPCETENAEAYSVMWKKDSVMIFQDKIQVGQRNDRYIRFNNQTLQIRQVQGSDSGVYECAISTSPKITAVQHHLTVSAPPRIIKARANGKLSVEIPRGGVLELECVAEGNPKPKVSWSKDGRRESAENVEYIQSKVIKQSVGRNDGGTYTCMADNSISKTPVLENVHVEVTHKPDMKVERIIVGESEMHLICRVHANPHASVVWRKNGRQIETGDNIVVERMPHSHEHLIKIKKVDESNYGNYSCYAKNDLGHEEKHMMVTGAPLTPKFENHKFKGENREVSTMWSIMSMTPIRAVQMQYRRKGEADKTWSTENAVVQEKPGYLHNIEHILKNLKDGVYEARLRAENQYGWSEFSRPISLEGKHANLFVEQEKDEQADIGTAEPGTSSGPRTIISWTTYVSVILLSMYSSFV